MNWYLNTNPQQIDLEQALAQVSEQRRTYALRYRKESDQRLSVAAWLLLQQALRDEFGIEEPPVFHYTETGKPLLCGHDDIHFNLSHCDNAVACAVGRNPVGIDVESIDRYSPELLPVTMSETEQQQILAAPRPEVAFIRLWTMKESLLKCTGEGLSDHLPTLLADTSFYRFQTLTTPHCICTLCETIKGKNQY